MNTKDKYIQKLEEYIDLLGGCLDSSAAFLRIHHWSESSENIENGKRLRSELSSLKAEMEKEDQPHDGAYTCTVCHIGFIDPDNGYDTCDECQSKI